MSDARAAVARLTPRGVGGVAVLEVRPSDALDRLRASFGRPLPAAGAIAYGTLAGPDADGPLDEVLVVGRPRGTVEVHLHGSPALVDEVERMLVGDGPRAERSPLTLEARAHAAAGTAASELGARVLLDQAAGALRDALARAVDADTEERARILATLSARGHRAQRLLQPARVVLVGPVNAGKSTLFNAIAGETIAAVTDVPGTTRDALGARARFGPWPIVLVDTAGERDLDRVADTAGVAVERAGQVLAREVAGGADLVLDLLPLAADDADARTDGEGARGESTGPPRVAIRTSAAPVLGPSPEAWGPRTISALERPDHARRVLAAVFEETLDLEDPDGAPWVRGRAVPFELDLVRALEEVAPLREGGASALASLVDRL